MSAGVGPTFTDPFFDVRPSVALGGSLHLPPGSRSLLSGTTFEARHGVDRLVARPFFDVFRRVYFAQSLCLVLPTSLNDE